MSLYNKQQDLSSFFKIVECMISNSPELEGCGCLFPDSVFFGDDGKPMFIAKTDSKTGNIISITNQNKLVLQDIRQKFSNVVAERKADIRSYLIAHKPEPPKQHYVSPLQNAHSFASISDMQYANKKTSKTGGTDSLD